MLGLKERHHAVERDIDREHRRRHDPQLQRQRGAHPRAAQRLTRLQSAGQPLARPPPRRRCTAAAAAACAGPPKQASTRPATSPNSTVPMPSGRRWPVAAEHPEAQLEPRPPAEFGVQLSRRPRAPAPCRPTARRENAATARSRALRVGAGVGGRRASKGRLFAVAGRRRRRARRRRPRPPRSPACRAPTRRSPWRSPARAPRGDRCSSPAARRRRPARSPLPGSAP
jgi:hypothetical protein